MWNSPRKTALGPIGIFFARSWKQLSKPERTTGSVLDTVGYSVRSPRLEDPFRQCDNECEELTESSFPRIASTTWDWRWRTQLAAVSAGARQVECTINGTRERAGDASLEELAMALLVRPARCPHDTSVVSEHLLPASQRSEDSCIVEIVEQWVVATLVSLQDAPMPSIDLANGPRRRRSKGDVSA